MSTIRPVVRPIVSAIARAIAGDSDGALSRYFTDLSSVLSQYGSLASAVSSDRIVMDVYSSTGSNVGLPTGAPVPAANQLVTLDFAYAGGTIQEFGRNGANYFDGIIANIDVYSGATLVATIPWNGDGTADEVNTVDPANPLSLFNISGAESDLYDQVDDGWTGTELWLAPKTPLPPELVDNGDGTFTAVSTTSNRVLSEATATTVVGEVYRTEFELTGMVSGSWRTRHGGTNGVKRILDGAYVEDTIPVSVGGFNFQALSGTTGTIRPNSIKRFLEVA